MSSSKCRRIKLQVKYARFPGRLRNLYQVRKLNTSFPLMRISKKMLLWCGSMYSKYILPQLYEGIVIIYVQNYWENTKLLVKLSSTVPITLHFRKKYIKCILTAQDEFSLKLDIVLLVTNFTPQVRNKVVLLRGVRLVWSNFDPFL